MNKPFTIATLAAGLTFGFMVMGMYKKDQRQIQKARVQTIECEGEEAAKAGLPVQACPYEPYNTTHGEWAEGWKRGWARGFKK